MVAYIRPWDLPIAVEPQSLRSEGVAVKGQGLRLAQKEEPSIVEGEAKMNQGLFLGLGVKIHQGVTAHEQVQVRERSITDQIVAPEDDRVA